MSEIINNSENRKKKLKGLILKLHEGTSQEDVKAELMESLKQIPYGEVIEVEQELISEGLPEHEILGYVMSTLPSLMVILICRRQKTSQVDTLLMLWLKKIPN